MRSRFCPTVSSSMREPSWYTVPTRTAPGAAASLAATVTPPKVTRPRSARWIPATILTKVDLPEPFSPMSPCTRPRENAADTWRSAVVEPKAFVRPSATRPAVSGPSGPACLAGPPGPARPDGPGWPSGPADRTAALSGSDCCT